ncbi:dihydrofolate reductase [Leptospira fletcheri]|uniref:Dihydrofolate reductase n=1 Tax=Leptospira fletcheri TaxID=2484981 RepID=A0A4R9GD41_9LEPT|nr:dihydrofolate reductase family protein [Leptospira fletcheri]TGK08957.1 dihydrofolate reductase [Leptospira fletcheri]
MRKIVFQMLTTLDGYYAGSNGEIDWHYVDDSFNEYAMDFLDQVDTLVFGRRTYELMAGYWPTSLAVEQDPLVAERMNDLDKIVCSRTLTKADWKNTRLIRENVKEEFSVLKKTPGKDIAIFGSSNLGAYLAEQGLIDEYRIMINPLFLGKGKPLFEGLSSILHLELFDWKRFDSGLVSLLYRPKKDK